MSAQQGEDKGAMGLLWIIFGVFAICVIIWWAFAQHLKLIFIYGRLAELKLIYWTIKWFPVNEYMQANIQTVRDAISVMQVVSPSSLNLPFAERVSDVVGEFLRWPCALLMLIMTYFAFNKNVKVRYKKHYDMNKLAAQESSEWPQINPVVHLDLVKQDLDEGPWSMSMPPMIFCKKNKLLEVAVDITGNLFSKGPQFIAQLIEPKAEQVFINQLGRLWTGPENMPIHRRALFAVFIARGCRDSAAAKNLVAHINHSCKGGDISNLDFTGVDELWKKHYQKREIQDIVNAHAYEFTLFTAILLYARQDGVFACSDFLWLKPKDRILWFVLNNVGRQTPTCEAAGVHAHFLAEKHLKRKLSVPVVKMAVSALKLALADTIYVPVNDEEKDELLRKAAELAAGGSAGGGAAVSGTGAGADVAAGATPGAGQ